MRRPRVVSGKKLLIASLGIAAATYVGCGSQTSGNLICNDCGPGGSQSTGGSGGSGGAGGSGGNAPDAGTGGTG